MATKHETIVNKLKKIFFLKNGEQILNSLKEVQKVVPNCESISPTRSGIIFKMKDGTYKVFIQYKDGSYGFN